QCAIDVGGRQADRPRADREPRAARVLRLDREQPLRHRDRIARRSTSEKLRPEPLGNQGRSAVTALYSTGMPAGRLRTRTFTFATAKRSISVSATVEASASSS